VHAWLDNPSLKWRALEVWAEEYAAQHGGQRPSVWVDALCADPRDSAAEQLAHTPVLMARSHSLLVLWGPALVDRMCTVLELVLWLALGGEIEHVLVIPIGESEDDFGQVVASVDAFAIMYAQTGEQAVERALVHAFQLATVPRINESVRAYLPTVGDAVDEARKRCAQGGDGVSSICTSPSFSPSLSGTPADRLAER
jgi:hypothetical protein